MLNGEVADCGHRLHSGTLQLLEVHDVCNAAEGGGIHGFVLMHTPQDTCVCLPMDWTYGFSPSLTSSACCMQGVR